jgi:hypothetical protein
MAEVGMLRFHLASGRFARLGSLAFALGALALPSTARGHEERDSFFPPGFPNNTGTVPVYRASGGVERIVCSRDSKNLIAAMAAGPVKDRNLQLLPRCRFRSIQKAVDKASSGDRLLVLPGVYIEKRSRRKQFPDPKCAHLIGPNSGGVMVPSYDYHLQCPNSQNLIAILGDTNGDRKCDTRCNLQIEGTGETPGAVVIQGDRVVNERDKQRGRTRKLNGIRADRADGVYLYNFTVEFFDFNGVYFHETDGFAFDRIVSRYDREYGVLSFLSDHGLYKNSETLGNGDSGLYPGAGPNLHGVVNASHPNGYGIEITGCDSHDNQMGYSGTAGGGTYVHHSRFHHNSVGIVTDSIVPDHPGMPEDACKWSQNLIYSNNLDIFDAAHDAYCMQPAEDRDLTIVCPSFGVPIGTGILIAGGNSNVVENNYIFDNWRIGAMLIYIPAMFRGDDDPSRQADVSNNNRYANNCMGARPPVLDPVVVDFDACLGTSDPNGVDFWWDEEEGTDCAEDPNPCTDAVDGLGNCWSGNVGPGGSAVTSDPAVLPPCPGIDAFRPPNASKSALLVDCTNWNPDTNPDPPLCQTPAGQNWFVPPPEP